MTTDHPGADLAVIDRKALDTLYFAARSQNGWGSKPVTQAELAAIYDIAKWGPTSVNCQPQRIVFLTTTTAKERLKPALTPGNVDKTMAAPVVAILAFDLNFYEQLPAQFPHNPAVKAWFEGEAKAKHAETTAFRNATLQAGYFVLAARAVGLDCGPMSGFDNAKVDAEFFGGTSLRSNFLCGLGHGEPAKIFPRSPRLAFDHACKVV